jgi:DNA-binding GntR family transcriptional regulator
MLSVREGIMEGRHPLNSPLREEALEAVYGTSRGPVREALRLLEMRGLVTHRERRGFRVRGYTAKSVRDLYRLRGVLERMTVEALAELDDAEIAQLVEQLNASNSRMEQYLSKRQPGLYLQENVVFHQHIVRASGNEMLERTLSVLNETAEPLRHALLSRKGSRWTSHLEHRRIADLIADRNIQAAAAVTESHILEALPKVLRVLEEITSIDAVGG